MSEPWETASVEELRQDLRALTTELPMIMAEEPVREQLPASPSVRRLIEGVYGWYWLQRRNGRRESERLCRLQQEIAAVTDALGERLSSDQRDLIVTDPIAGLPAVALAVRCLQEAAARLAEDDADVRCGGHQTRADWRATDPGRGEPRD